MAVAWKWYQNQDSVAIYSPDNKTKQEDVEDILEKIISLLLKNPIKIYSKLTMLPSKSVDSF